MTAPYYPAYNDPVQWPDEGAVNSAQAGLTGGLYEAIARLMQGARPMTAVPAPGPRYGYTPGASPESQIVGGLGGRRSMRQSGGTFLTEPIRGYAAGAASMAGDQFPGALAASKGIDTSDPVVARAARDQWLKTVLGGYTDTAYVDEEAGRAADIAQRGIQGMMKSYGGGAYAKSILDTRAKAALDVRGRERGYQHDALGLAPSIHDVATRPQQDLYRRFVTDPVEISGRYGQSLTQNPLSREELTYGKTKKPKKKFDWGGFAASAASSYLNSGGGYGGWGVDNDSGYGTGPNPNGTISWGG